jgi:hypothetical protein
MGLAISKLTGIKTMSNLPNSITEIQKYFIENGWYIVEKENAAIVAKFQVILQ